MGENSGWLAGWRVESRRQLRWRHAVIQAESSRRLVSGALTGERGNFLEKTGCGRVRVCAEWPIRPTS